MDEKQQNRAILAGSVWLTPHARQILSQLPLDWRIEAQLRDSERGMHIIRGAVHATRMPPVDKNENLHDSKMTSSD
jgi:hypothetical protein